jgi:hypothetical protein
MEERRASFPPAKKFYFVRNLFGIWTYQALSENPGRSRRLRMALAARRHGESWVRGPFEPGQRRGRSHSVPPSVGRIRIACFVVAPRRLYGAGLRGDASQSNRIRPIVSIQGFQTEPGLYCSLTSELGSALLRVLRGGASRWGIWRGILRRGVRGAGFARNPRHDGHWQHRRRNRGSSLRFNFNLRSSAFIRGSFSSVWQSGKESEPLINADERRLIRDFVRCV